MSKIDSGVDECENIKRSEAENAVRGEESNTNAQDVEEDLFREGIPTAIVDKILKVNIESENYLKEKKTTGDQLNQLEVYLITNIEQEQEKHTREVASVEEGNYKNQYEEKLGESQLAEKQLDNSKTKQIDEEEDLFEETIQKGTEDQQQTLKAIESLQGNELNNSKEQKVNQVTEEEDLFDEATEIVVLTADLSRGNVQATTVAEENLFEKKSEYHETEIIADSSNVIVKDKEIKEDVNEEDYLFKDLGNADLTKKKQESYLLETESHAEVQVEYLDRVQIQAGELVEDLFGDTIPAQPAVVHDKDNQEEKANVIVQELQGQDNIIQEPEEDLFGDVISAPPIGLMAQDKQVQENYLVQEQQCKPTLAQQPEDDLFGDFSVQDLSQAAVVQPENTVQREEQIEDQGKKIFDQGQEDIFGVSVSPAQPNETENASVEQEITVEPNEQQVIQAKAVDKVNSVEEEEDLFGDLSQTAVTPTDQITKVEDEDLLSDPKEEITSQNNQDEKENKIQADEDLFAVEILVESEASKLKQQMNEDVFSEPVKGTVVPAKILVASLQENLNVNIIDQPTTIVTDNVESQVVSEQVNNAKEDIIEQPSVVQDIQEAREQTDIEDNLFQKPVIAVDAVVSEHIKNASYDAIEQLAVLRDCEASEDEDTFQKPVPAVDAVVNEQIVSHKNIASEQPQAGQQIVFEEAGIDGEVDLFSELVNAVDSVLVVSDVNINSEQPEASVNIQDAEVIDCEEDLFSNPVIAVDVAVCELIVSDGNITCEQTQAEKNILQETAMICGEEDLFNEQTTLTQIKQKTKEEESKMRVEENVTQVKESKLEEEEYLFDEAKSQSYDQAIVQEKSVSKVEKLDGFIQLVQSSSSVLEAQPALAEEEEDLSGQNLESVYKSPVVPQIEQDLFQQQVEALVLTVVVPNQEEKAGKKEEDLFGESLVAAAAASTQREVEQEVAADQLNIEEKNEEDLFGEQISQPEEVIYHVQTFQQQNEEHPISAIGEGVNQTAVEEDLFAQTILNKNEEIVDAANIQETAVAVQQIEDEDLFGDFTVEVIVSPHSTAVIQTIEQASILEGKGEKEKEVEEDLFGEVSPHPSAMTVAQTRKDVSQNVNNQHHQEEFDLFGSPVKGSCIDEQHQHIESEQQAIEEVKSSRIPEDKEDGHIKVAHQQQEEVEDLFEDGQPPVAAQSSNENEVIVETFVTPSPAAEVAINDEEQFEEFTTERSAGNINEQTQQIRYDKDEEGFQEFSEAKAVQEEVITEVLRQRAISDDEEQFGDFDMVDVQRGDKQRKEIIVSSLQQRSEEDEFGDFEVETPVAIIQKQERQAEEEDEFGDFEDTTIQVQQEQVSNVKVVDDEEEDEFGDFEETSAPIKVQEASNNSKSQHFKVEDEQEEDEFGDFEETSEAAQAVPQSVQYQQNPVAPKLGTASNDEEDFGDFEETTNTVSVKEEDSRYKLPSNEIDFSLPGRDMEYARFLHFSIASAFGFEGSSFSEQRKQLGDVPRSMGVLASSRQKFQRISKRAEGDENLKIIGDLLSEKKGTIGKNRFKHEKKIIEVPMKSSQLAFLKFTSKKVWKNSSICRELVQSLRLKEEDGQSMQVNEKEQDNSSLPRELKLAYASSSKISETTEPQRSSRQSSSKEEEELQTVTGKKISEEVNTVEATTPVIVAVPVTKAKEVLVVNRSNSSVKDEPSQIIINQASPKGEEEDEDFEDFQGFSETPVAAAAACMASANVQQQQLQAQFEQFSSAIATPSQLDQQPTVKIVELQDEKEIGLSEEDFDDFQDMTNANNPVKEKAAAAEMQLVTMAEQEQEGSQQDEDFDDFQDAVAVSPTHTPLEETREIQKEINEDDFDAFHNAENGQGVNIGGEQFMTQPPLQTVQGYEDFDLFESTPAVSMKEQIPVATANPNIGAVPASGFSTDLLGDYQFDFETSQQSQQQQQNEGRGSDRIDEDEVVRESLFDSSLHQQDVDQYEMNPTDFDHFVVDSALAAPAKIEQYIDPVVRKFLDSLPDIDFVLSKSIQYPKNLFSLEKV